MHASVYDAAVSRSAGRHVNSQQWKTSQAQLTESALLSSIPESLLAAPRAIDE